MPSADDEKLRKQVYELNISDLIRFPAWNFASDEEGILGQDEATVRPYLRTSADPGDGLMVIRARFTLSDGTELAGYVYPPPPNNPWDLQLLQPVLLVEQGQIPLWFGMFPPPKGEFQRLLNMLGKTMEQVFPLIYESDVELVDAPVNGIVRGFSFLKDGNVDLIAV
jgi:hypothetical protein